ncbi:glyoxalase/bleomycin resistance/dioxygenase family protein [Mesorhizobium loti]|uniref:Glyoxalase/bleomycin resistance/dioxygenase family protein n=1 Tax=Mesorhizobium loti R88b TaxID=935548 RepID=A0A6M7WQI0_RHILI|nr:glyoxalase/bleomycin resistance/dioxygenase family protein [Mesorhizobium loti]QKD01321.1 glyoxalase/bleomycin resistance/dioxygenase family protein [Mesorhizobium loti R88b]
MTANITGGINIAMKVPPHQYKATIAFYRDVVGLEPFTAKAPAIGFVLGPNRLWIDEAPMLSQAEVWLELFTDDFSKAAAHFAKTGVVRCDAIEPLGEGFRGGWIANPASIIHMLREPDAW